MRMAGRRLLLELFELTTELPEQLFRIVDTSKAVTARICRPVSMLTLHRRYRRIVGENNCCLGRCWQPGGFLG